MSTEKKVIIGTLTSMLMAVLFPPWGPEMNPFQDQSFGFLFTGPVEQQFDYFTYIINWQYLGVELLAITILGAIIYTFVKK